MSSRKTARRPVVKMDLKIPFKHRLQLLFLGTLRVHLERRGAQLRFIGAKAVRT